MKKLFSLALLLLLFSCNFEDSTVDLKAKVSKSATQILITNQDDFGYDNCEITINGDYISKINYLGPLGEAQIGLMEFYDSDGTRFNPFQTKVLSVSIWCDLADEKNGFFYGELN